MHSMLRQLASDGSLEIAANNAADTLGWVALFEEGAVYMPPGTPEVATRAGLEQVAAAGFGPYAADIQITPAEVVVSGDWAFARSYVTGNGDITHRRGDHSRGRKAARRLSPASGRQLEDRTSHQQSEFVKSVPATA